MNSIFYHIPLFISPQKSFLLHFYVLLQCNFAGKQLAKVTVLSAFEYHTAVSSFIIYLERIWQLLLTILGYKVKCFTITLSTTLLYQ